MPEAPLRVCFLIDTLKYDAGTERLVPALASRLDSARFEVHICCFESSERLAALPPHVRREVFPLVRVHSPVGLRQAWRFRQYIRRHRIDVVHSFMTKSDIFGVLSCLHSRPVVVTSRLNSGYWYTPAAIRLFRLLNRYTTHILSNSFYARNIVASVEKVDPEKITVLYPGVDLHRYSTAERHATRAAALGIPANAPVVGIVANYRPVKDLALFLRAAAVIATAVPDAAFLLVGNGELRAELEDLSARLGIRDRVHFSNGRGAVPDYLARMSVACLSSHSEGLSNAVMEYMAAGLPAVVTDVGGNAELILDGATGFLVRERTPEAFAAPVVRLLRDASLRERIGQAALQRARTEFDMNVAVRRLEEFYLAAAPRASQPRSRA